MLNVLVEFEIVKTYTNIFMYLCIVHCLLLFLVHVIILINRSMLINWFFNLSIGVLPANLHIVHNTSFTVVSICII